MVKTSDDRKKITENTIIKITTYKPPKLKMIK